jgi:hypothetical protein
MELAVVCRAEGPDLKPKKLFDQRNNSSSLQLVNPNYCLPWRKKRAQN